MNFPKFRKVLKKDIASKRDFAVGYRDFEPMTGWILCSEGHAWRIRYSWQGKDEVGLFSKAQVYIVA